VGENGVPSPKPSITWRVRVRYAETDAMGLLHHANYFVYFEEARTECLRQGGVSYRDLEERGVYLVVARARCTYRAAARYDDVLLVHTTVERVTGARIDHSYRMVREADGLLVAEAETTLACVDRGGKLQPIPEMLRQLPGMRPPSPPTRSRP
jgi:acyl-CoA thioester hydrolase